MGDTHTEQGDCYLHGSSKMCSQHLAHGLFPFLRPEVEHSETLGDATGDETRCHGKEGS